MISLSVCSFGSLSRTIATTPPDTPARAAKFRRIPPESSGEDWLERDVTAVAVESRGAVRVTGAAAAHVLGQWAYSRPLSSLGVRAVRERTARQRTHENEEKATFADEHP